MDDFKFSDAFLDMAFKAIIFSECENEEEQKQFNIFCDVCAKHNISVRTFIEVASEIEKRIKEDG